MQSSANQNQAAPPLSLSRRAVSGAAWIAVEMCSVQGFSLVVFAVMARFVGPAEFGTISLCLVVLQCLKSLLIDNVAYAVMRKQSADHIEYTTAFWITVALSALAFSTIELGAGLLQRAFEISGLADAMRKMGTIVLIMGLARTHECWMLRHFEYRSLAIRSLAGAALGGSSGIALAASGYGIEALIAQQVVTYVTSLAAVWYTCKWKPTLQLSTASAREIIQFMSQTTPNGILGILNQNLDTVLVAYFFGPVSTGFYGVSKRLRLALQLVASTPITGTTTPALAEVQYSPERFRHVLSSAIYAGCTICAPLFLGLSAVSNDAIVVLFGAKWIPAAPILEWLSIGGLMAILTSYNETTFVVKGHPIWLFYLSAVYTALVVPGFLAISHFDYSYLAVPFVAPYLATLPLSIWLCSHITGLSLRDWLRRAFPSLTASLVMFSVVRVLGGILGDVGSGARLLILCLTGALVYGALLASLDWANLRGLTERILSVLKSELFRIRALP
jgi:lipopolysaccharide exporter